MAQALWMRLREVQWDQYEVAEGSAARLEKVLQDLASRKHQRAMKASHEVWRLLCKGETRSAAVVVLPYLVEIMEISVEDVQLEIADCIKSCASALPNEAEWHKEFQQVARETLHSLKQYKCTGDLEIAVSGAVEALQSL